MAGKLATQARVTIDSASQGNVRLRACKDSKVADGSSVEPKNGLGEDDPIGVIRKPGAKTISLNIYQEQGAKPEVDYHVLKDRMEAFVLTREVVGGATTEYSPAYVSKIDEEDDEDGGHMMSVEVIALKRRRL